MKQNLKGLGNVFSFTLKQQLRSKGYKAVTIVFALICFLLPAIIMPAMEAFGGKDDSAVTSTEITTVYTVDLTAQPLSDLSYLNQIGNQVFCNITYISCDADLDLAAELSSTDAHSLLLVLEQEEDFYDVHILRPENTELTKDDAEAYESFINDSFRLILIAKSGLDQSQLTAIYTPAYTEIVDMSNPSGDTQEDPFAVIRQVLSYLLPYLNIMILYFLVLFYGQNVANNVIMEKTSKLMDTFLVSIKPGAMILGKVFAIVLSSILQFAIWVVVLILGFAAGTAFVRMINPDTDMLLIRFFESIGDFSGVFSIPGIVIALLMIFGGFLLYCSIASIGGSAASKPEDLSSTNVLFTLILIVSFFCTLSSGAMTGEMSEGLSVIDLIPFTSILVTPSRILLGTVTIVQGLLSLAVVLLVTLVLIWLAGKVYKMMSLYKGNPPKPNEMMQMLKHSLKDKKTEA